MKSVLFSLEQQRAESGFSFAGFEFPKYIWDLPKGSFGKRIKQRKPVVCGAYYHAPKPQGRDGSQKPQDGASGERQSGRRTRCGKEILFGKSAELGRRRVLRGIRREYPSGSRGRLRDSS